MSGHVDSWADLCTTLATRQVPANPAADGCNLVVTWTLVFRVSADRKRRTVHAQSQTHGLMDTFQAPEFIRRTVATQGTRP